MGNVVVTKDGDIYRIVCGIAIVEVYDEKDLGDTLRAVRAMEEKCNETAQIA